MKHVKRAVFLAAIVAILSFALDGLAQETECTTVHIRGERKSCLVAHFSALPQPADNHIVFQVRVDGVPMEGHHPDLFGFGTSAVSDPNQTDQFYDVPRMASYSFFKQVEPGAHVVEVLFAGCCSGTTGIEAGIVSAAVLTLEHR